MLIYNSIRTGHLFEKNCKETEKMKIKMIDRKSVV